MGQMTKFRGRGCAVVPSILWIVLASALMAAVPPQAKGDDLDASLSPMRALVERYATDLKLLERKYPVPMSGERRERLAAYFASWRERLDAVEFERLDRAGQVDHVLLSYEVARAARELEHEQRRHEEVAPLLPFAPTIVGLEEARRRMDPLNPSEAATTLAGLTEAIEAAQKHWTERSKHEGGSGIKPTAANRAARLAESLQRTLREWYRYYDGYDPLFTWWAAEPYADAERALQGYARFVRGTLAGVGADDGDAIIGDPIGREALIDALRFEMIRFTPEQLVEIARREHEWCLREMKKAAGELGYGEDWHAALEHVKTLHVQPGEQPELIRRQALEAIEFVESRDLLTVPDLAKEGWRMEMMSPERQKVSPYFLGGESIIVSYPTNAMSHKDKLMSMRGNNPYFCRAVVHHELIPGHHLQGFMTDRYSTHRQLFRTPFWIEGWALYWEMLLWDLDFASTPEQRIGMLFWRMHRCARIIVSLKFHLGEMTTDEMIAFLVERVGHERLGATSEVRRYVGGDYGPLYQVAYMIGGLQLRALHEETVGRGRMTDREFHDVVLAHNAIPVELIRAGITGTSLDRESGSVWRFAG